MSQKEVKRAQILDLLIEDKISPLAAFGMLNPVIAGAAMAMSSVTW